MNRIRQQGFTLWEISFYVLFFFFVLACALKLGPRYIDDRNIAKSIEDMHRGLAKEDIYEITNSDIKGRLSKFFQVSMIPEEILKQIEVERNGGKVWLRLNYESRIEFIGNIDIVINFSHEVDLSAPAEE